jgi:crotonobetainyl-CoA:carnitine CoA-transferase CaiB-like acyl-CoA transferase
VINVRPGVEQRLGIDEATLRRLNPKLVFCFITGFGADGPYAHRPAYDNVGQALAGWLSRFHDSDDARVAGPAISDAATGSSPVLGSSARCWSGRRPAWDARSKSACSRQRSRSRSNRSRIIS